MYSQVCDYIRNICHTGKPVCTMLAWGGGQEPVCTMCWGGAGGQEPVHTMLGRGPGTSMYHAGEGARNQYMYHAGEGARNQYVPCWGGGQEPVVTTVSPTLGGNKYVPQLLPLDLWAHDLSRSTFQSSNPIGPNIIHDYMRRCPNNTLN